VNKKNIGIAWERTLANLTSFFKS